MPVDHVSLNARGDQRTGAGFERGAAIAQVAWGGYEMVMVIASLNRGCALDSDADALVRTAAAQVAGQRKSDPGVAGFGLVSNKAADVMIMPLRH